MTQIALCLNQVFHGSPKIMFELCSSPALLGHSGACLQLSSLIS